MRVTERGRRALIATAMAAVVGGGGVAVGAAAFGPATAQVPPATAAGADGAPAGTGVVAVTSGGPADQAGIRAGDVIRSFGATPTPDSESLTQALASAPPPTCTTRWSSGGAPTPIVSSTRVCPPSMVRPF